MPNYNKAILIGHLGRDPETRYLPNGTAVCNFTMATTEKWTKDGEKQSRTEWHRIEAWGKLAEICGEYLSKGQPVLIEGSIKTDEWEDQEGKKRQTTKIKAREMQMLGTRERTQKKEPTGQPEQDDIPF